jgi:hypothetical protein
MTYLSSKYVINPNKARHVYAIKYKIQRKKSIKEKKKKNPYTTN